MGGTVTTDSLYRRTAPRASVGLALRLARHKGSEVVARTLDVGCGGMCVRTARPLAVDELLHFDLDLSPVDDGHHVGGDARVLREQGVNVYALRIERADAGTERALGELVTRLA